MRIYVTHCSAKKDNSLKGTGKKVTPNAFLYGHALATVYE